LNQALLAAQLLKNTMSYMTKSDFKKLILPEGTLCLFDSLLGLKLTFHWQPSAASALIHTFETLLGSTLLPAAFGRLRPHNVFEFMLFEYNFPFF
jgi:hypothetical protein